MSTKATARHRFLAVVSLCLAVICLLPGQQAEAGGLREATLRLIDDVSSEALEPCVALHALDAMLLEVERAAAETYMTAEVAHLLELRTRAQADCGSPTTALDHRRLLIDCEQLVTEEQHCLFLEECGAVNLANGRMKDFWSASLEVCSE